jgi:Smr domain
MKGRFFPIFSTMKFSIGDKIVMKHTGEEGTVVAYLSPQMVEVEAGGTVFPAYIDDIDHPYLRWFTDKKPPKKPSSSTAALPVEKPENRPQKLAKGIYLAFLPVFKHQDMEDVVDYLKVYLFNELPGAIKFSYDVRFLHQSEFSHEGLLHGFGNLYLHNVNFADMNDQPRFHWRLNSAAGEKLAPADGILRIRPQKLFEQINKLLVNNESMFSYLLIDDFLPPKKLEKPDRWAPPVVPENLLPTAPPLQLPSHEIDLHIEALVDNIAGMTNAEIMKTQLDTLERQIHLAIVHRQERLYVIHGLGKGKLREEVHNMLRKTPEVEKFVNEWTSKYGFGATEVFFKR